MANITEHLNIHGHFQFEGYSQQVQYQVKDLIDLTSKPNIDVMEIGFNAGHSADVFLKNNPTLTLTSFDLGQYNYVLEAKRYIDKTYPGRHTLIIGDSTQTVPKYIQSSKDKKFDVIFIDGGHEYSIVTADIDNCAKLAHKDTTVVLDDTVYVNEWVQFYTVGPTRAWLENVANNKIIDIYRNNYDSGRGMSWGKYVV